MKIATYLILAVVAVLTLASIVAAIITALQILVYVMAAALVIWVVVSVTTYFNKDKEPKEPPA